jgi:hypothetical protein
MTTGHTRPAHFDGFIPRNRFDLLKKTVPFAFADLATKLKDVWYMVTPVVKGFNENRRRTTRAGRVLTMDELMAAFRPRTSKRGGLPHLSFIMRKPKPLGTVFKCVADGSTGIMLFLELQKGAERMGTRAYVKETRSKIAACGLRLAFGSALKGGEQGGVVKCTGLAIWMPPPLPPWALFSPTHKRTEGRAPVWGSEFTSKSRRTTGGDPAETAPRLHLKLRLLTAR